MSILLIVEHNNKELRAFTLNAITAASQIDGDVHALLIGNNCSEVAKSLLFRAVLRTSISIATVPSRAVFTVFLFSELFIFQIQIQYRYRMGLQ
jgi:electron transfer flavoprotein alpha subunit